MARKRLVKITAWLLTLLLIFSIALMSTVGASAADIGVVTVVSDPLRVRTGAGTSYSILQYNNADVKLPNGTYVDILSEVNCTDGTTDYKWYRVSFTYSGAKQTGYVASPYIKVTAGGEAPSADIPEIYKEYLRQVQLVRPNWKFEFYDTGLDWNAVLDAEGKLGTSLISKSRPISWRSKQAGAYDPATNTWIALDGTSWFRANRTIIAYYMDPRNFMNEIQLFQFEKLSFDASSQTIEGVQAMLKGTFMESAKISDGVRNISYAEAYMEAARRSGVSPYHLVARTIQEVGRNGSGSTSGSYGDYPGYYNYYNIGATAGKDPVSNGLNYASKEDPELLRPWNTPYKAIVGGALFIGKGYIAVGQDTLYYQKFSVVNSKYLYWHQYMGNIEAPFYESKTVYSGYSSFGVLGGSFTFNIPIYKNMPAAISGMPGSRERGDLNGDGKISMADALMLFQYVSGVTASLEDEAQLAADLDGNGKLTMADALRLFQYVSGVTESL